MLPNWLIAFSALRVLDLAVYSDRRDDDRSQEFSLLRHDTQEAFVAKVQDKIPSLAFIHAPWPEAGWGQTWFRTVHATGLCDGEQYARQILCKEPCSEALEMLIFESCRVLNTDTFSAYQNL